MSYDIVLEARNLLINNQSVTSLVEPANIRVGWSDGQVNFPSVSISTVGETDVGYLGFGTAPEGSRLHRIEATIQIDIISKTSIKETLEIADAITKVLLGNSFSKQSEVDIWDDMMKAHRRMLRFRKTYITEI